MTQLLLLTAWSILCAGIGAVVTTIFTSHRVKQLLSRRGPDPRHPSQLSDETIDLLRQRERDFGYEDRPA